MKRNCNGCKAFDHVNNRCDLRHNIVISKRLFGCAVQFKPTEECEKPKTYGDLVKLMVTKHESL